MAGVCFGVQGRPLHVRASDGVQLEAIWMGTPNPKARGWILLHGLGSIKEEWTPLTDKAAGPGAAFALMDLRGHGKSGGQREWNKMAEDLDPVIAEFSKVTGIPRNHIGVGGASLGANLALRYAAAHPEVPAVVLLSPGLEYAGIGIEKDFARYGTRALFMAASPQDPYAFVTVQQFARRRNDPALRVAVGQAAQHGVQMLTSDFEKTLQEWMRVQH